MTDPREQALARATKWLDMARRRVLAPVECWELVEAVGLVPGLLRPCVHALSCQRDTAAVDALLALPAGVPGLVDALYGAFAAGVTRTRVDGAHAVPMLALDFRRSRSRSFQPIFDRAQQAFADNLEYLDVQGQLHHRVVLDGGRGTLAGRASAAAYDLQWLHERLSKLRGTRLWLNGWCFDDISPIRPPIQAHLLRGWLSWAARQVATRTAR